MQIKQTYKALRKILVFNPSFIGDAILTTPLLKALKKILPEAEITFCVRPESMPVLKSDSWTLLPFDKRGTEKGARGLYRFSRKLAKQNFDAVLAVHKSTRSVTAIAAAMIPLKIGFDESALSKVLTHRVSRDMSLHEAERNLMLLAPLTDNFTLGEAKTLGGGLYTYLDKKYTAIAKKFISVSSEKAPVVGFNPGSTWATKRWPAHYFALTAHILHKQGFRVAIFGGPDDADAITELSGKLDFEYFNFADKVPFDKIPALVGAMDLFITNDSAPMHIAVSQNTPVVAVFGATVPELGFAPYGGKHAICENKGLNCRPCGLHGKKKCPEKHFKCMKDITPEDVAKAALALYE